VVFDCEASGRNDAADNAKGANIEMPKASRGSALGSGFPLPSRLGGLGEHCKLLQRSPSRNWIWWIFDDKIWLLV